jgi:hypothetical protein
VIFSARIFFVSLFLLLQISQSSIAGDKDGGEDEDHPWSFDSWFTGEWREEEPAAYIERSMKDLELGASVREFLSSLSSVQLIVGLEFGDRMRNIFARLTRTPARNLIDAIRAVEKSERQKPDFSEEQFRVSVEMAILNYANVITKAKFNFEDLRDLLPFFNSQKSKILVLKVALASAPSDELALEWASLLLSVPGTSPYEAAHILNFCAKGTKSSDWYEKTAVRLLAHLRRNNVADSFGFRFDRTIILKSFGALLIGFPNQNILDELLLLPPDDHLSILQELEFFGFVESGRITASGLEESRKNFANFVPANPSLPADSRVKTILSDGRAKESEVTVEFYLSAMESNFKHHGLGSVALSLTNAFDRFSEGELEIIFDQISKWRPDFDRHEVLRWIYTVNVFQDSLGFFHDRESKESSSMIDYEAAIAGGAHLSRGNKIVYLLSRWPSKESYRLLNDMMIKARLMTLRGPKFLPLAYSAKNARDKMNEGNRFYTKPFKVLQPFRYCWMGLISLANNRESPFANPFGEPSL